MTTVETARRFWGLPKGVRAAQPHSRTHAGMKGTTSYCCRLACFLRGAGARRRPAFVMAGRYKHPPTFGAHFGTPVDQRFKDSRKFSDITRVVRVRL